MGTERGSVARLDKFDAAGSRPAILRVSVPKAGLGIKDIELLLAKMRGLTGCPACAASGGHRVVFDDNDIRASLGVDLKTIKATGGLNIDLGTRLRR